MSGASASGPYLTALDVVWAYCIDGLRIELGNTPSDKRHLILTGPNGSGKSSILRGLFAALTGSGAHGAYQQLQLDLERANHLHAKATGQLEQLKQAPIIGFEGATVDDPSDERLVVMLPATRQLQQDAVSGPQKIDWEVRRGKQPLSRLFEQHLVNRRFDQLIARDAGDTAKADAIQEWFSTLTTKMREIFADPKLDFGLEPETYHYHLQLEGTRAVTFDQLPDGFANVLLIWAEVLLHCEAFKHRLGYQPSGLVLIDELELHLHAQMQETVLPFLTGLFPQLQFIITTHSPAIASSVDDAWVYDLRTREGVPSTELRGIRYGNLFKAWFGIETDFDLQTTAKLRRFDELAKAKPVSGTEEHTELERLAGELHSRSHVLGLDVWRRLGGDDD